jgi:hypothetical protein
MKRYVHIYRFALTFFVLMNVVCLSSISAAAPPDDRHYMRIDYIKAVPGGGSDLVKLEREIWEPVHTERLRRGLISYRGLYHVMAGGPDTPYDYVVITIFDDFGKIDDYRLDEIVVEVYPSDEPEEIIRHIKITRNIIRTEIWQVNGAIPPEGAMMPGGKYTTVNFFDARGGSGEHAELEFEFWGPIHELRIERKILNSWAMYTLLFPEGDVRNYTYSTMDYYDLLGDVRQSVGMELARIAHPDLNDGQLSDHFSRTGEARNLYKTELWKLIHSIGLHSEYY